MQLVAESRREEELDSKRFSHVLPHTELLL